MARPKIVDTLPPRTQLADRVEFTYRAAPSHALLDGITWYPRALRFARRVGQRTGRTAETVAGVLAALSPQISWEQCKALATEASETGRASRHFLSQTSKANAILAGVPAEHVLRGKKERAFYGCIMRPRHAATPCIDRHAAALALGHHNLQDLARVLGAVGGYEHIAGAYKIAATRLRRPVPAVQAVVWVCYRAERGL